MAQSIQKWMLKSCISKQSMQLRKLSMATRYISIYPASSSSSINVLMKKMTRNDDNQQQTLSTFLLNNRSISTIMNSNNVWHDNNNDNGILNCKQIEMMIKRNSHKPPLTVDYIRERILLVLRLYDKIDPDKLTIDSHFYKDLGLDSLDHVEIIMAIEDEFHFEIPDGDAEKLNTPRDILNYIQIKEEIYSELEHRDDHHSGGHH